MVFSPNLKSITGKAFCLTVFSFFFTGVYNFETVIVVLLGDSTTTIIAFSLALKSIDGKGLTYFFWGFVVFKTSGYACCCIAYSAYWKFKVGKGLGFTFSGFAAIATSAVLKLTGSIGFAFYFGGGNAIATSADLKLIGSRDTDLADFFWVYINYG